MIGDKIAELRKQKNMTQETLGKMIGVSAQSISKWENNTTMPDIMLLPIIAEVFDVSIDTLFDKNEKCDTTIPLNHMVDVAYEEFLETMQKIWNSLGEKNFSQSQLIEAAKVTKQYLNENSDSQTVIFF